MSWIKWPSRHFRDGIGTRSSVYDFGHHGQRADGAGANTGGEQQFGEVLRTSVCCRRQIAVEPSQHHVARSHFVMIRKDQVWQRELTGIDTPLGPAILRKRGQLAHDAV